MLTAYWTVIDLGLLIALSYLWPLLRAQLADLTRRKAEYSPTGLLAARGGLALVAVGYAIWIVSCLWVVWCSRLAPQLTGVQ